MLTAFPLPWHSPLHPQTGQQYLSWERVSARARCPHLPGKASCRLSSVSVGLSPETVQFLVVSDDLGAVMYLQRSKGEWNSWAYPHARKDCLGLQKSENKVNVSVVTGMKVLFLSCCCFSCLRAFLLVLCARVHLNWFSVLMVCAQGDIPLPLLLTQVFVTKPMEYPLQPQLKWEPQMCSGYLSLGFPIPNRVLCYLHPVLLVLFCPCGCVAWIPFG